MGDFPDPDEEYELMYADELDLLREDEGHADKNVVRKNSLPAKRSLDFSSPVPKKTPGIDITSNHTSSIHNSKISLTPNLQPLEDLLTPENGPNKRTTDDLFGDIGDIDFDDVQLPSKRLKTDEESDMELIEKIIEGRRLRQILAEPPVA